MARSSASSLMSPRIMKRKISAPRLTQRVSYLCSYSLTANSSEDGCKALFSASDVKAMSSMAFSSNGEPLLVGTASVTSAIEVDVIIHAVDGESVDKSVAATVSFVSKTGAAAPASLRLGVDSTGQKNTGFFDIRSSIVLRRDICAAFCSSALYLLAVLLGKSSRPSISLTHLRTDARIDFPILCGEFRSLQQHLKQMKQFRVIHSDFARTAFQIPTGGIKGVDLLPPCFVATALRSGAIIVKRVDSSPGNEVKIIDHVVSNILIMLKSSQERAQ